jgi:hypothetical protein
MNILSTLLFIVSFFFLFLFESFFLNLLGFSLFAIVVVNMWGRVKNIWFFVYVTLFGLLLDTIFQKAVGLHMSVIALGILLLEFLSLFVPKDSRFRYITFFLFFFLYYIFSLILNSLLTVGIFPNILPIQLLHIFFKSVISVILCILVENLLFKVRDSKGEGRIRLK